VTLFLVGPTAVGKTELAIDFALQIDAEIVGVDSMQIYSGLGILSAAPRADQLARVPHHLVGVLPPDTELNAAHYAALARDAIADIRRRGRNALVVGGAGLYVKALTHGLLPRPPADPALRRSLTAQPLDRLLARLQTLDRAAWLRIDRRNPRRVVRALEIALCSAPASGEPPACTGAADGRWTGAHPDAAGVLLRRAPADLRVRIDRRVDDMFAAGLVEEVRRLPARLSATAGAALGLAQVRSLIAGTIYIEQCRAALRRATWAYARRQMTWFRGEDDVFLTLDLSALPDDPCARLDALRARMREAEQRAATRGARPATG